MSHVKGRLNNFVRTGNNVDRFLCTSCSRMLCIFLQPHEKSNYLPDSKYGKGNGVGWISRNDSQDHYFTHVLAMQESIKNWVAFRKLCIIQVL